MKISKLFALSVLALGVAQGAHATTPQRIAAAIDATQTTPLSGNVHPLALRANDLGAASPSMQMTEMTLRFNMTDAQQTALNQLLEDQQNPASVSYHQWLTPEQFASQFGLSSADLAKVTGWLSAQGFTVTDTGRGGTFVRFSGTAGQVQAAFHTQIHRLSLDGAAHFGNLTAPVLPAAIAAVTNGVTGLHDFRPHAHHHVQSISAATASSVLAPQYTSPQFTSSTSGNHYVAPGDFYTIYGVGNALSSSLNGTGVTIAVAGQTDISLTDIANFRSASGLPANPPTVKLYGTDPGTLSDDLLEAELDVEWSGAVAPNASILFVNSKDVIDTSLTQAIDNNLAPIVSISYGVCETALTPALLNSYNNLMAQANAQGQTIVAASGDSGATDCDYQATSATQGLAVDFPAVLPTVTGVGGTMFNEGSGSFWGSTNGSTGGSASSYIPEAAWNETGSGGIASGGGGSSLYLAKPSWQTGTGVPADSARDVPDVSFNSAASHDGYLVCTTGYCVNGYRDSQGFLSVVGGTSVAAPSFAGMLGLVVQKTGGRLGNVNPKLYALFNSTYAANVFHDVTTGTNASPCTTGTTNCASGGSIGYAAGVGYDRATGLGSVDAFNLVNDWALVGTGTTTTAGNTASTTALTLSSGSVTQGTAVTLTAKVASGSTTTMGTPTGTVQFTVDGSNVGSAVTLASGTATYSLATATLASGTHTLGATYSGDTTFAASKGSASLNVTAAASADFSLTPTATTVTTATGTQAQGLTFTVAAVNGFTGNVTFTATATSSLGAQYAFSVNPVALSSTATTGATVLSLYAYTQTASAGLQTLASTHDAAPRGMPWTATGSGIAMAGLLMLVLPKRRKLAGLAAAMLFAGTVFVSGCGAGSQVDTTNLINKTTPGTYTVNVSASGVANGTTVTHTATVTFVVQ